MKKTFSSVIFSIILIFSNLSLNSCGRSNDTVSCFPNAPINVILPLNSMPLQNSNLQNQQWTYIDMDGAGTRGLIIVKTNNGYSAYDRNAPHICPSDNTTLNVDFPKVICPKDNAKWMIITGEPLEVSSLPLKRYLCNYDASTNTITIFNN